MMISSIIIGAYNDLLLLYGVYDDIENSNSGSLLRSHIIIGRIINEKYPFFQNETPCIDKRGSNEQVGRIGRNRI